MSDFVKHIWKLTAPITKSYLSLVGLFCLIRVMFLFQALLVVKSVMYTLGAYERSHNMQKLWVAQNLLVNILLIELRQKNTITRP